MKFNHSQRTLHPDQSYTPPPNYYNLAAQQNKIITGSLYGPSIAKQQPSFGLSQRFTKKQEAIPGPGSYFAENKREQKLTSRVKAGIVIREYKKQAVLGGQDRTPSIPYTQFNLDEEDQQYVKDLLIKQDVNKSFLALKKKNEGYTFPKSPRSFIKNDTAKRQENVLGSIAEYSAKIYREQKTDYRQQIKRTNERRAQIINRINPQFIPSLQLIQLITKRRTKYTPGPGAYNTFKNQAQQAEPGVSFSNSKRFSADKQSDLGPGKYVIKQQNKKSISMSKSARNLFNLKNNTDLEHRFYIDPYSNIKNNEQIASKLKSQSTAFGSNVTRFTKLQKQPKLESQLSYKQRKQSKIEKVVQMRLKKLNSQKMSTAASQGLLGIQSMISALQ